MGRKWSRGNDGSSTMFVVGEGFLPAELPASLETLRYCSVRLYSGQHLDLGLGITAMAVLHTPVLPLPINDVWLIQRPNKR